MENKVRRDLLCTGSGGTAVTRASDNSLLQVVFLIYMTGVMGQMLGSLD